MFHVFAAAAIFSNTHSPGATVPYATDFEGSIGSEWSSSARDTSHPSPFTSFSGRFSNDTQSLTITELTAGASYVVGFDFYPRAITGPGAILSLSLLSP